MREALALLRGGDAELYGIIGRTLVISGMATLIAMLVGVPLGYALARGRFPGRTMLLGMVNTAYRKTSCIEINPIWSVR